MFCPQADLGDDTFVPPIRLLCEMSTGSGGSKKFLRGPAEADSEHKKADDFFLLELLLKYPLSRTRDSKDLFCSTLFLKYPVVQDEIFKNYLPVSCRNSFTIFLVSQIVWRGIQIVHFVNRLPYP